MTIKALITMCLLLGSVVASAQPANAEQLYVGTVESFNPQHQTRWPLLANQGYISKAQAIDIARQQSNGKILSAKLIQKEQHAFYKIKVLTDQGRIKTLRINARR